MDEVLPGERIRPSASVILWRRAPELEVFLAERSMRTRFFPGYHVFPGGIVDEGDGDGVEGRRTAALRELFEETGVLSVVGAPSGSFPREEARALVAKGEPISPLLQEHGLSWDITSLVEAGRLLTPPFAPVRYDTSFYILECPAGEAPEVDGTELVSGAWMRPADALARWESEAFPLPPPTLAYLRMMDKTDSVERTAAMAAEANGRPHHERFRIELHPCVYALPLRTPTLPPATTQNCYLLDGSERIVIVDPGTPHAKERVALFHTLDIMLAEKRRPVDVLLTHYHHDHVGSAAEVKARFGGSVLAHEETAARLKKGLVDRHVKEGDLLALGTGCGHPWSLRVLETPGHAPGHLAFRDERWGALFVGDLVSGVSTILVDPEEGHMGEYLAALDRLAALDPPLLLAGHGPVLPGKAALVKTAEHRRQREAKVIAALTPEPRPLDDLLAVVYSDTPESVWPLARESLRAHLLQLQRLGQASAQGDMWRSK